MKTNRSKKLPGPTLGEVGLTRGSFGFGPTRPDQYITTSHTANSPFAAPPILKIKRISRFSHAACNPILDLLLFRSSFGLRFRVSLRLFFLRGVAIRWSCAPHLRRRSVGGLVVNAAKEVINRPILDVVFQPLEEVKKELLLVPTLPQASLARQKYSDFCEAAINEQINVEYNVSYVYHAMYAYFDRDNVALKGLANFFKESSIEEREHAEKFMEYQNKRGGQVKLQSMMMPISNYDHLEKGDALYAMELALSLEKLTNEKLLNLHKVADENNDIQLADFLESEFLAEQVESIKKISEYVAQLRRVGRGHGVWHFDQMLVADAAAA